MVIKLKCLQRMKNRTRKFVMKNPIFSILLTSCISSLAFFIAYQSINKKSFLKIYKKSFVSMDMSERNKEQFNTLKSISPVASDVTNTISKLIKKTEENPHGTSDEKSDNENEKEFKKQWFRVQKQRVDWKQILAPCANNTIVGQTPPGWGKENATSLKNSYVEYMDIRPAGQFSKFFIRTKTDDGRHKVIGGDFWKVILFGPAIVAATVFDHGNGSYEAVALIADPGSYSLVAIVERTLCEGMLDPTPQFIARIMYRIKMKSAKKSDMGLEEGCCLSGRLPQIKIDVVPSKDNVVERIQAVLKVKCSVSCPFIWTGLGRFINGEWTPFLPSDNHDLQFLSKKTQTEDVIFFYGGSVTVQFAHDNLYLRKSYNVCDTVFKRCEIDYLQFYPMKSRLHPNSFTYYTYNELKKYGNTTKEFKPKIIIDSFEEVFRHSPGMDSPKSLFVLNLNVQLVRVITFAQYKDLIGNVTYLLVNREKLFGSKARVVWRTSTALNYRGITHRGWGSKFLTSARTQLFAAYALSEMCKAGIDVLEWYPESIASPLGRDRVHFKRGTFYKAMDALMWYSLPGTSPKTEKMCFVP